MKFANYKLASKEIMNIGDSIQIIAMDYIYKSMGINEENIIYIDKNEISIYNGEPVLLPVFMPMLDYYENGHASSFSSNIIPCYLALTLVQSCLTELEVTHYKQYEPIGCRDEYTLKILRKYNINSYLNGCITQLFPQREIKKTQNKIYIVDVEEKMLECIPNELRKDAIYRTHHYKKVSNEKDIALNQYNEYKENAMLVITSLLHASVPSLAAGIPTILLREFVSSRMSWLEKLIPIYDKNNCSNINWKPKAIDYSVYKQKQLNFITNRLWDMFVKYRDVLDISSFYENRNKSNYINEYFEGIKNFIDENWKDSIAEYRYSIWGVTTIARWCYEYIHNNYPNAKLCHVYDSYKKMTFYGLETIHPNNIEKYMDEFLFITFHSANASAINYLKSISKPTNTYVTSFLYKINIKKNINLNEKMEGVVF